jgi:hypothetical protein
MEDKSALPIITKFLVYGLPSASGIAPIVRAGKRYIRPDIRDVAGEGETFVDLDDDTAVPRPGIDQYDTRAATIITGTASDPVAAQEAARLLAVSDRLKREFICPIGGIPYRYTTGIFDQLNLLRASVIGGKLWRVGQNGWEFAAHTAEEAQAVLRALDAMLNYARETQT